MTDPVKFGPELCNAYAQILAIRATTARHQRDYQTSVKLGEQALKIVPDGSTHLQMIVSAGLSTSLIEMGDLAQADFVTSSTRHMAYQTGHAFIAFSMLMNELTLAMLRGQLHKVYEVSTGGPAPYGNRIDAASRVYSACSPGMGELSLEQIARVATAYCIGQPQSKFQRIPDEQYHGVS